MNQKISEWRMISLLLVVFLLVLSSGILLYKKLSLTAVRVSGSVRKEIKTSSVIRQISLLSAEAENHVRSFRLTHDQAYLLAFYKLMPSIDSEIALLKTKAEITLPNTSLADTIVLLTQQRFELLRSELDLETEERVTEDLTEVSKSIDRAFQLNADSIADRVLSAGVQPKESFFHRLFGRRSKKMATDNLVRSGSQSAASKTLSDSLIKGHLKKSLSKTRQKQLEKLSVLKAKDLLLSLQSKRIVDQINRLVKKTETLEHQAVLNNIGNTKQELTDTKYLAAVVSILICLFLFLLVLTIVRYVRTKKQFEQALFDAKREAEDLAKTKDFFLANMSHEIKTPLNAIHGFTEQVLQGPLNPSQQEQLSIVKKSADYLNRLVTNILNYSKLEAGKLVLEESKLDVRTEMKELELLFEREVRQKNVRLSILVDSNVPAFIQADPICFKQVFFNVVGNALKFTEQGQVNVLIEKLTENNHLKITVTDTGIGIPAAKLPHLFNEYAQAGGSAKKYGGTGLGLVITKKLLNELGGHIRLSSVEGQGTEVEVILPYKESVENSLIEPSEMAASSGRLLAGKSILIVDDEIFNRLLLQSILSKYKVSVQEATNGVEAVDLAFHQNFDLIIMDIRMPLKDGIEACREIRKFEKDLPILASSAVISDEKISRCLEAGYTGFVHKPFTEQQLVATVSAAFNGVPFGQQENVSPSAEADLSRFSLEELDRISGGDETFGKELLTLFHQSINKGLEEMDAFTKTNDWDKMADLAHKMIPPCKHFNADKLQLLLRYFEALREKTPRTTEVEANLIALRAEVNAINLQLQLYL